MVSKKPNNLSISQLSKISLIMILDVIATLTCFFLGLWFRADFSFANIRETHMEGFLTKMGPWCLVVILVFLAFRLYNSIWAFVSTSELFRIIGAYGILAVLGLIWFHFDGSVMPRSSMVVGFVFSFICTVGIRYSYRMWIILQRKIVHASHGKGMRNVMIIGAGDAGHALALEFNNSHFVRDHLACVIDDNPVKLNKHLCGVPIVGNRQDIPAAVKKYKIHKIIFAIPSCNAMTRKQILDICSTTGGEV